MKANAPENMYIPEKIYLPYKGGKIIGLVKETGTPYKSGVDVMVISSTPAQMPLLRRCVMLIVDYATQKNVVILASVYGSKSLENV